MPDITQGPVSAVYQEDRGFTLYIEGKRYRAWEGDSPVAKGDVAEVKYDAVVRGDKTFYNIAKDGVRRVSSAPPAGPPSRPAAPTPRVESPAAPPAREMLGAPERIPADIWERKDLRIARESIISSICALHAGTGKNEEEIVRIAKRLEKYVYSGS